MADYSRKSKYRPGISIDPTSLKWSPASCND